MQTNTFHKYAILPLVIMVFLGVFAFAQDDATQTTPQNPPVQKQRMGADPATRLQRMAQQLNLTDDQKAQIQPILQNEAQQLKALRVDTSLTPDQRRAKVQEIRKASRSQIEPILTPEQVAKLPKPGMNGHRGMGRGMKAGGGQMGWMSQKLNLTDEQNAKIQPLFANQHAQVQAIRQDSSLAPEQKQAKIAELRKSTRQQFMAVLTPEQQQTLKENMRARRGMRHGPGAPPSAPPDNQATPPQSM